MYTLSQRRFGLMQIDNCCPEVGMSRPPLSIGHRVTLWAIDDNPACAFPILARVVAISATGQIHARIYDDRGICDESYQRGMEITFPQDRIHSYSAFDR
jgi:hypothetical protein